ncbi:MAG TPA: ABC transporter permease [Melioribacteraceae bacterium]|nr:ABC transporter permease [Melioribacteraceae bacterium]
MNKIENFKIGIAELKANMLRTALTMLGIIFGVGAVIAMLSIGEGARQETLEQIELLGTNNIIIKKIEKKQNGVQEKNTFSPGLNLNDANSIIAINPFIEAVTPQLEYKVKVMYKSEFLETNVIGTSANYPSTFNSFAQDGMFFNEMHISNYATVCVIGNGIKEQLFKFESPIDKKIKLGTQWFRIIGVLNKKNVSSSSGENLGFRNFNDDIYIPITTMTYKLEKPTENQQGGMFVVYWGMGDQSVNIADRKPVTQLTVKVKDGKPIRETAELIEKILKRKHYGVKDYEVIIPEQLLEQKQKTQKIFNIVMGAIAGISLLVGGIGIMNIMLANILERTKEIGIRRAIGATKQDVLEQFIYEAIVISVIGGLIGIITGYIITGIITSYAEWRTVITPFSVILAFTVSVCVGLIFGIYPAKKAADKDPIEALRYE